MSERPRRPRTRAEAKTRQARQSGQGKGKQTKGGRRWLSRTLKTLLVLFLLGVGCLVAAYLMVDIPRPNDAAKAQTSIVYFADGKTEMARISEVNRESVAIGDVPDHVQKAMLAAEDRDFYRNSGISPTGIARGAWQTLRGGDTQSGSTITQQYVKNYFLTQDQTLQRKAREILISVKINRELSKDQILENYLNTIYYGRNAYGIKTAAKSYFNKDVSQLTVSEGALLASVIRAPSLYDPRLGEQQTANAQSRFQYVIDGMAAEGWLTPAQVAEAAFPATIAPRASAAYAGPNGYVVKAVRDELRDKLGLSETDIDTGGLRITTTIDKKSQEAAITAVQEEAPQGETAAGIHVGLTAIKPGDGAIVASYGGADYLKEQFDVARQATIQAGSTFKVFTLIAALQDGISTRTTFPGYSPQRFEEFEGASNSDGEVRNFGNSGYGTIDLRRATQSSVNTVYARLNIEVGPERTKAAAIAAGLPDDAQAKAAGVAPLSTNYANVLGTDAVRIVDMANAYATIAADGVRATPYLVKGVTSSSGYTYEHEPETKAVFDKDVMADTIDAMERVVTSGSGEYASRLGRPAAGKTGTTSDNYGAWFDGYVPQLAAAVGMYKGDGSITEANQMKDIDGAAEVTGGSFPVRIWTNFMEKVLDGQPEEEFPERAGVGDDEIAPPRDSGNGNSNTPSSTSTTTRTQPPTRTPTTTRTQPPTQSPTSSAPSTSTPTTGGGDGGGGDDPPDLGDVLPTPGG